MFTEANGRRKDMIKTKIDALIDIRIKKGFSQRELARKTGLSCSFISQIEKKNRNVSPSTAKKICDALEVDFEDIFFTKSVSSSKHTA
jgi:putative transcriptional regulator